jgi:hypothetical protein
MHSEVNKQYSLGGFSVGITDGSDCEVNRSDGLRWHDIHTKSYFFKFISCKFTITLQVEQ